MDYCLVYLSSASKLLVDEELLDALHHWRENNRAAGITGILLYFNGSILQVLEGDQRQINGLYEVISKDCRHTQVIQLYNKPIERRSFPDWLMGYKTLSGQDLDHLGDLIVGYSSKMVHEQGNIVQEIVQIFYQNNHRI